MMLCLKIVVLLTIVSIQSHAAANTPDWSIRFADSQLESVPDAVLQVKLSRAMEQSTRNWLVGDPVTSGWSPASMTNDDAQPPEIEHATFSTGPMRLQLGKQKLRYSSLIHRDQERKGTAASWNLGKSTHLQGFGLQSADRTDLHGFVFEHQWQWQDSNRSKLVGGWLTAQQSDNERDARAWSLAGDTALWARRLKLKWEYARSYVQDRADQSMAGDAAAYRLQMEVASRPGNKLKWRLGTEQSRVAPNFIRLANSSLTRDRDRLRTYGDLKWQNWRIDWSIDRWQNNLSHNDLATTSKTGTTRLGLAWSPNEVFESSLIGRPSYELVAQYGRLQEYEAVSIADRVRSDRRLLNLTLNTRFKYPKWLWGVKAARGRTLHTTGERGRDHTFGLDLYGDFTAIPQVAAKPILSWRRKEQAASGLVTEKWSAKLKSSTIELDDDLKAGIDAEFTHCAQSDWSEDRQTTRVGGLMVWTLQNPGSRRKGLALTLSGDYLDTANSVSTVNSDYRVMLALSTSHPLQQW